MYRIKVQSDFDSAHFLVNTGTKCDELHGHRWTVWITLCSEELTKKGWVVNFKNVKKWLSDIIEEYDHGLLNFYIYQPTAENLCFCIYRHIYKQVQQHNFNHKTSVSIEKVEIAETPNNIASYSCSGLDVKSESLQRAWRKRKEEGIEELSEKQSKKTKESWKNKEHRKRRLKGLREANKKEPLRKLRSERMKGKNNPMANRKTVEKMMKSLKLSQKLSPNKEEKKVIKFFKENKINLKFVGNGKIIIDGKIPDFINEKARLIVEYNNRFWHCDDNPWYDVKDDSKKRKQFFKRRGYHLYIIWDDDFKENPERIRKEIKQLLRKKK